MHIDSSSSKEKRRYPLINFTQQSSPQVLQSPNHQRKTEVITFHSRNLPLPQNSFKKAPSRVEEEYFPTGGDQGQKSCSSRVSHESRRSKSKLGVSICRNKNTDINHRYEEEHFKSPSLHQSSKSSSIKSLRVTNYNTNEINETFSSNSKNVSRVTQPTTTVTSISRGGGILSPRDNERKSKESVSIKRELIPIEEINAFDFKDLKKQISNATDKVNSTDMVSVSHYSISNMSNQSGSQKNVAKTESVDDEYSHNNIVEYLQQEPKWPPTGLSRKSNSQKKLGKIHQSNRTINSISSRQQQQIEYYEYGTQRSKNNEKVFDQKKSPDVYLQNPRGSKGGIGLKTAKSPAKKQTSHYHLRITQESQRSEMKKSWKDVVK